MNIDDSVADELQSKRLAEAAQASGEGQVEWYNEVRQHVMARPDMYISSTTIEESHGVTFRVSDRSCDNEESSSEVVGATTKRRKATIDCLERVDFKADISPAFLKYLDEIVSNAHDNGLRDATQRNIKIAFDQQTGKIVVWNDGTGIEPTKFKETDRYTIAIIFGEYMSGTNLSSTTAEEGSTETASARLFAGGRNGYGISLVNTFSSSFIVETACPQSKTLYRQEWSDNMSKEHPAKIKTFRGSNGYVKIECVPDWKLLGMPEPGSTGTPQSVVDALSRRAWDIATCSSLRSNNVSWCTSIPADGGAIKWPAPLPITNGQQFLKALVGESARGGRSIAHDVIKRPSDGLAVFDISICSVTPEEGESLDKTGSRMTAFVNGIRCCAGTHVRHAMDRVIEMIREKVRSKAKRGDDMTIKPQHVQNCLAVCIVCLVADKSFDSQAKEKLTTPARSLGFSWTPSDKFKAVLLDKTAVVESVISAVSTKEAVAARKAVTSNRSNVSRIAKYDPPASTRVSKDKRYLLITEGDSAKSFVIAGVSAIGRDFIGIYSLRGKVMNSRNNSTSKVQQNRELTELARIMGLKPGETYTKEMVDALPFDHLVLVVDQDMDGSHIGGLVMWWFVDMFPSLLKVKPDYIQRFYTALVKATPSRRNQEALQFYSMGDYERWAKDQTDLNNFNIKYYKGLGTSTSEEAREYFKHYQRHLLSLRFNGESCEKMMETFFDGKKTAERKQLLSACDPDQQIDFGAGEVSYETVVTKDLSHFAMYDTERAIPNGLDGFKPGQRKVNYFFTDKRVTNEMKVAQAGAAVAQYTNYHHGEVSLTETIVGMAIEHVGTNNIPLLVPKGQFGSRLNKPSVHSAPRYIFTHLNEPFVGKLFRREDDPVLERVVDEGHVVEPKVYCGVIPMLLINGSSGIGTGWSTFIPPHNPMDVIAACKKIAHAGITAGDESLSQVQLGQMLPYYDGFVGTLTVDEEGTLRTEGKWEVHLEESKIVITELPVGVWGVPYEEFIKEKLMTTSVTDLSKKRKAGDDAGESNSPNPLVIDIFPGSSETRVRIELLCDSEQLAQLHSQPDGIVDVFKLRNTFSMRNMWIFDEHNKLHRLSNAEELIWKHAHFRLDMYNKRKAHQIATKEAEIARASEILRFVEMIISGELVIVNRPMQELVHELEGHNFTRQNDDTDGQGPANFQCFKYLLGIPLYSITAERAQKLRDELQAMHAEITRIRSLTSYGMWFDELNELEEAYHEYKAAKTQRQGSTTTTSKKGWGKRKRKAKKKATIENLPQ